MTQQSYPNNSEEATSSSLSDASSGTNSTSTSSTDVYPLPLSLGQTEIVVNNDDPEGALVTEFSDANFVTPNSNFYISDSSGITVGNRTVFASDVVIHQYINGTDLPQIHNGAIGQDEVQCNKNVRVVPPPVPTTPIDDEPKAGAGLLKRHFKVIMILLTIATVICAATLITLRLVGTKKPNYITTTTTTEEPSTTGTPPARIHYTFNKTQWGGRVLPDQEAMNQPVHLVIVKHTNTESCEDTSSCFTAMQELQNTDVGTNRLHDIRYNFVIGGDGNIYEGRGWGVRNEQINNTIDVAYMGNFNEQVPREWVVGAGKVLVVQGMMNGHLDYSSTTVVCHNQTEDTDSPGENLYREVIKWKYYSDEIINVKVVTLKDVNNSTGSIKGRGKLRRFHLILSASALCLLATLTVVGVLINKLDQINYTPTQIYSTSTETIISPTKSISTSTSTKYINLSTPIPASANMLFIPKEIWGGVPGRNSSKSPLVHMVVIKHTGGPLCTNIKSCSARVREIQKADMNTYHMDDIRYNFLIGGDGKIYIGRGWGVQNEDFPGSMDIAFIGNFSATSPPAEMLSCGSRIIALARYEKVLNYPSYVVVNHNQTEETDSPGEMLFEKVKAWKHYSELVYYNFTAGGAKGT